MNTQAPRFIARQQTNGVGLAGFICSLVGIFSCGLLSPIGAILSFFGLFKRPRGLAIAGFVIGLAGSMWVLIAVFVIGVGTVLAALGWKHIQAGVEMAEIRSAIDSHIQASGNPPATLDLISGASKLKLTDPWGNAYRYEPDPTPGSKGFSLSSDGPDGKKGTQDDLDMFSAEHTVTAPSPPNAPTSSPPIPSPTPPPP